MVFLGSIGLMVAIQTDLRMRWGAANRKLVKILLLFLFITLTVWLAHALTFTRQISIFKQK